MELRTVKSYLFSYLFLGTFMLLVIWKIYNLQANGLKVLNNIESIPVELASQKIVVGAVACRLGDDKKYLEETWVMLKSILISAYLYNVPVIEFHLFLEYLEDEQYFQERLQQCHPAFTGKIVLAIHSAVEGIPEKYRKNMIENPKWRCGYTRFFFPNTLPEIDSIIHFDSDMIYTGNIQNVWSFFSQMKNEEMIGVARQREPKNDAFPELEQISFGAIPHIKPRGVNAGLMLMNLTRLREYEFPDKICQLEEAYGGIVKSFSGQKALNIVFYFNPSLMHLIPCHFNFGRTQCLRGLYCNDAKNDPHGIQIVHGTNSMFNRGKVFYPIYRQYQEFNMTSADVKDIVKYLMLPIKNAFNAPSLNIQEQCTGTINDLLFNDFF